MITIFTIPKAFDGHIGVIQRNAIGSWVRLNSQCQVILCGNDPGTEEVAKEFNVQNIPHVERNEFGTPLLSSAFLEVKKAAFNNLLCYVNADIVFLSDFIASVRRVKMKQCLILGNRWNVDIRDSIDFGLENWELQLRERVKEMGSLQAPVGSDYFVFRKDEALADIPPFAVGRPGWDNWFIYNARKKQYKVIDASQAIMAIHQNHDYAHIDLEKLGESGKINWEGWEGPEIRKQKELLRTHQSVDHQEFFTLLDATHILTDERVNTALGYNHLRRAFDTLPVFFPRLRPIVDFVNKHVIAKMRKYRHSWLTRQ
jgi:hypothetical protein